jgi:hypothetical protein
VREFWVEFRDKYARERHRVLPGGESLRSTGRFGAVPAGELERSESFDTFLESYRCWSRKLLPLILRIGDLRKSLPAELAELLDEAIILETFLHNLLSYVKFFPKRDEDASPSNYYMEREWRIQGHLDFTLDDVSRVVLPSAYSRRFRSHFPEYFGQVTFNGHGETFSLPDTGCNVPAGRLGATLAPLVVNSDALPE